MTATDWWALLFLALASAFAHAAVPCASRWIQTGRLSWLLSAWLLAIATVVAFAGFVANAS